MVITRICPKCGSTIRFRDSELEEVFTGELFEHPLSENSRRFLSDESASNYKELWDYDNNYIKSLKCPVCGEELLCHKPVYVYIVNIEDFTDLTCHSPWSSNHFKIIDIYFDEVDSGEMDGIKYILLERNKIKYEK